MSFPRDTNDPIQRRRQQFDDVLSGKRKSMKLESVEHFEREIATEKKASAKSVKKTPTSRNEKSDKKQETKK